MSDLDRFSDDELRSELKRRTAERRRVASSAKADVRDARRVRDWQWWAAVKSGVASRVVAAESGTSCSNVVRVFKHCERRLRFFKKSGLIGPPATE